MKRRGFLFEGSSVLEIALVGQARAQDPHPKQASGIM